MWTDRQKGKTNKQNYTNFDRNLAMMVIYVPIKFEKNTIGQTVFELESGNKKCGLTDGHQTHPSNRRVGYTQPA